LLLFAATPAWSGPFDDPLSEAAIREEFIARALASGAFDRVEARPDGTIDLTWGEDQSGNAYLGNLIKDMLDAPPAERENKLQGYVETAVTMARRDDTVPDRSALRISIYDDTYIREAHRLSAAGEDPPTLEETMQPRRRIAGSLWQVIVVDTPQSTYALPKGELEKMGLSPEEAWAAAELNLRTLAAQTKVEAYEDGFWLLSLDGYYENALLTVPDVWAFMSATIGGTPVAMSPARGFLLVGKAEDPASIAVLRDLSEEVFETRGHPISTEAFIWRDGSWALY
jgi:hypothetical protein